MPVYVKTFDANMVFVLTSVGSILGALFNYGLGLAGSRFIKNKKEIIKKSKKWLDKWGDLSVFITSFIPGFPFDVIAIAVGIFKMNIKDFVISMSLGKAIKYALLIYGTDFFLRIFLGV
ncbi:MAG: VTT domain-containing protein [Candidatus Aenigmarchaeota archaeon]|nr:VTT domain-containing protein [Candidatus Aenigmarchaeota archaeon]